MASELLEHFYGALTGRGHTDESSQFVVLLSALVDAAGSGAGAARLLGISPTTVYRWRSGRQQPKMGRRTLAVAVRRAQLSPTTEREVKRKEKTLVIEGVITFSKDTRHRKCQVGRHIPARKMGNIVNAWLSGDDQRAERLLWKAIDQHYAPGMDIDNLTGAYFE